MSPEEARELHYRIMGGMDSDHFVRTMLAAVCRNDEEVVRLELAAAFAQDRNTRSIVIPESLYPERFTILSISARDQERIYL